MEENIVPITPIIPKTSSQEGGIDRIQGGGTEDGDGIQANLVVDLNEEKPQGEG